MIWEPPKIFPSQTEIGQMIKDYQKGNQAERVSIKANWDNLVKRLGAGEYSPTCRLRKRDRIGR